MSPSAAASGTPGAPYPRAVSSAPEWTPDQVVDADLAARVVAEQFPHLAGRPVRPFGAGWDNVLHAVGPDWLFRFVHRDVALPGAARELAVLRHLAGTPLPLAVPVPELLGRPTPELPRPFWGARRIPGREIAHAPQPAEDRLAAADAVGRFLGALHAPEVAAGAAAAAATAGAALPVDPLRRGDPAVLAGRVRPRLAQLAAVGVPAPWSALEDLLAAGERLAPPAGDPVLVHGDLHVRHVLVDDDGAATGVVDWGDTALADPAVDLMVAWSAFAGPARAALLAAYGRPVPGGTELRARVLAVHVGAALLLSALDGDDGVLVREATAVLSRAIA